MASPAGRYSYRTLLLATCLGLALGAAALFTAISWRVQSRATHELEDTRVQLALLQVNRRVQVLLSQAIELNHKALELVNPDRVSAADFDNLGARILPVLRQSSDINYVGAALASTGESFFLRRLPTDSVVLYQCIIVAGAPTFFQWGAPPGRPLQRDAQRPIDKCDARDRPFYTVAAEAGAPAWTPSYLFLGDSTRARRGVSFSSPVFHSDGKLAAVVETDLETETLSTFLARLRDRFPGEVFVLEEPAGGPRRLLAHPRPEVLYDSVRRRPFESAAEVTDPGVAGIVLLLTRPFKQMTDLTDRPLRFGRPGERFTGAFTLPVGSDRPNWLVAVALPESVALADLRRGQRNALLAMAGLALLTVVIAGWLSRRLSNPIELLVSEARENPGEPESITLPPTGPTEVMRLAQVYQSLLAKVRANRDALASLNRELLLANAALQLEVEGRLAATSRSEALEQQLLQSQKFEAMGTMAGGIAHEFNNMLTAILGNLELLEADFPPEGHDRDALRSIRAASELARDLVKRILTFSRREAPERRRVRARDVMTEATVLLRAASPSRVRIRTEQLTEYDLIDAEPARLVQVLVNLGTNAFHAMKQRGGELRLAVAEKLPGDFGPATLGLPSGRYVELIVSDTGHGVPPEALGRIFDPFFTTKPAGEGTGLGLAIVYNIVQAHGGVITVSSRIDLGTEFRILLPAVPDPAAELPLIRPVNSLTGN